MMYQTIQGAIKDAMKSKDVDKRDTLKMAVAKAQDIAKTNKCDITDDIMLDGIKKELKQLNQTKDSLVNRQESDLYKSTLYKIEVLSSYLPKMMDENETADKVDEILSNSGADNKGTCMKLVMAELKGKADNKIIAKCVDDYLKKLS
jgi:hypothetical protein